MLPPCPCLSSWLLLSVQSSVVMSCAPKQFLLFGVTTTWAWSLSVVQGWPAYCRRFSTVPGIEMSVAILLLQAMTTKTCLQTLPHTRWQAKSPSLGNFCLEGSPLVRCGGWLFNTQYVEPNSAVTFAPRKKGEGLGT